MISFDEAIDLISGIAKPLAKETEVLDHMSGQVLAEPVIAKVTAPSTNVSAMDGYAVREADIRKIPKSLTIIGESFAGSGSTATVAEDQAIRIFTGAPMPQGADRVIMQEIVRRHGDTAMVNEVPGPGSHVRLAGSDFQIGEELLPAGRKLGPCQLVTAAAADSKNISVWRKPHALIICTGDELVASGTAQANLGGVPDSVSHGVAAIVERWGGHVTEALRLADDLDLLKKAATIAVESADIIIVTGGASVGERDYAKAMFEACRLDLIFSKVAIKPGKPVWLGRAGGSIIIGLPGNPTAAMVTARLLLAPLSSGLAGADPSAALQWEKVSLSEPLSATGDRETFVRGDRQMGTVRPFNSKDSSAQKILGATNCILRCAAGLPEQEVGASIEVLAI